MPRWKFSPLATIDAWHIAKILEALQLEIDHEVYQGLELAAFQQHFTECSSAKNPGTTGAPYIPRPQAAETSNRSVSVEVERNVSLRIHNARLTQGRSPGLWVVKLTPDEVRHIYRRCCPTREIGNDDPQ